MSGWSTSPSARSATLPDGRGAEPASGRFHRRRRARPARERPGASRLGLSGARLRRARLLMPRSCSPTSSAAAPRRGCSRAARGAGPRLFGLRVGAQHSCRCRPVLTSMSPTATAPTPAASIARSSESSPKPRRDLDAARARARPRLAKAGMLMSLESCWGQASYLATRLLARTAGWSSRPRSSRELDAVDARRGARGGGATMLAGPRARRHASAPSSRWRRERSRHARRRALGRLGPDRLRQRPEARALRPVTRRPARAAGDVGAGARRLGPRRDLRPRLGRGRRRALGPASAGAARSGSWRAAASASTPR